MIFRRGWWLWFLLPGLLACAGMKSFARLDDSGYYVNKSYAFKVKGPAGLECWEEKFESEYLFIFYHWEDCRKSPIKGFDGRYFVRAHQLGELGFKPDIKEWIERRYGGPVIDTVSKKGIQGWVVRKQVNTEITYSTRPWWAWYFVCYSKDKNNILIFCYDGRHPEGVADFEALVDSLEFLEK